MSVDVASGLTSPMVNQMPTPVIAPKTSVSRAKNWSGGGSSPAAPHPSAAAPGSRSQPEKSRRRPQSARRRRAAPRPAQSTCRRGSQVASVDSSRFRLLAEVNQHSLHLLPLDGWNATGEWSRAPASRSIPARAHRNGSDSSRRLTAALGAGACSTLSSGLNSRAICCNNAAFFSAASALSAGSSSAG